MKTVLGQDTSEARNLQTKCTLPLTSKETTLMHCIAWKLGSQWQSRAWLKDMKAAGVDLEKLGATEWCIWKDQSFQREFNGGLHRVIGITYGSRPEDWYIWQSEPSDSFVGDFWALVARPAEIMPGGWPVE